LSSQLGIPLLPFDQMASVSEGLTLVIDELGLSLQQLGKRAPGPVRCDFVSGPTRHRRLYGGGKGQDIAKAVGLNRVGFKPNILDLTAGLGRDGFVLASLGANLQMFERNPIVYSLLEDGIARAKQQGVNDIELSEILNRISLFSGDSEVYLRQLDDQLKPDIIYIDPMFPAREKSSKVKKEMQLFHQLVGADDDSAMLLALALDKALYRVVVKRPAHAPYLAERQPGYSLKGKSTRYDIYPIKKLPD
jgi:16S rRNA (guanine1516-N2)-methyltransferase